MGRKAREKRERRDRGEIAPKKEKPVGGLVSVCRRIILLGTFLILFTPLVLDGGAFFPFVGPKSLYFMGLALIIFAVYLLLISLDAKYRPRLNVLLIAIILFVIVLIFSAFLGEDPSRSFWSKYERMTGLLMWFHLLAFFVVLSSVFKKQEDWFKIFGVSIFAALFMSAISLFARIGVNLMGEMGAISQGGATIGNSSFMGTYLLFNVFLALYLFLKTTGNLRIFSGISLAIISLALFLSGARAAIFSLFGGAALLFFLWLIFCKKGKLKLVGTFLLALFAISALYLMYFSLQPGSFVYEQMIQMATKSRMVVWQMAWQGWLERPWLGWGPENFDLVFTRYFHPSLFLPEYGGEVWFDRAHNIILDTLVAAGLIGLLSYLGIFVSALSVLWRKYFREKIDFWTAGIFSTLLVAYFVQNLTVFDMVSSYMLFFLTLGFIAGIASEKKEIIPQKNISSLNPLLAAVISILFSFSFFIFVIQPLRTGYYVVDAPQARPASPQRLDLYKKTLETSPLGKYQIRTFFADAAVNFSRTEAARQVRLEDFKLKLDFLGGELEKSLKESPLDFRSHLTLGHLYSAYAQIDPVKLSRAEEVIKRAIELSPVNQQGYWALSQIRLQQGDFEEAISLAEKAVELEPRVARSHFILVQIAMLKGDKDFAEEKAREAIEINSAWEAALKEILEDGS